MRNVGLLLFQVRAEVSIAQSVRLWCIGGKRLKGRDDGVNGIGPKTKITNQKGETMGNENLKNLIEVHNLLYHIPVAGAYVVPMAQALVTLQSVISDTEKMGGDERE